MPFLIAVALAIAFGGGLMSTLSALDASAGFGAIRVGAWRAFPQVQTANADPYARSHRAKAGRLLYGTAEGLTFTADTDDSGRALNRACSYRIKGSTPTARLWTLFAADSAGMPLQTAIELPSAFNSRTVLRARDGSFEIVAATSARPGNWLALPPDVVADKPRPDWMLQPPPANFSLVLTLLDTPTAGSSGLVGITMPAIETIGCGND